MARRFAGAFVPLIETAAAPDGTLFLAWEDDRNARKPSPRSRPLSGISSDLPALG